MFDYYPYHYYHSCWLLASHEYTSSNSWLLLQHHEPYHPTGILSHPYLSHYNWIPLLDNDRSKDLSHYPYPIHLSGRDLPACHPPDQVPGTAVSHGRW